MDIASKSTMPAPPQLLRWLIGTEEGKMPLPGIVGCGQALSGEKISPKGKAGDASL